MFLSVCADPDILSVMYILNNVLTVIKVLVPLFIITTGIISLAKAVTSSDDRELKNAVQLLIVKFFVGACIFFVPTFLSAIFSLVAPKTSFTDCFTKATKENIQKAYLDVAAKAVSLAEDTIDRSDYSAAVMAVKKLDQGTAKNNLEKRLEIVKATIEKEEKEKIREKEEKRAQENAKNLSVKGAYSTAGNGKAQAGVYQNSEPDPSAAINYWKNILNPNNFIYPRDQKTGLPLGAWPKNYGSIPTQLSGYKTYMGRFIWPVTPVNGSYNFVYQHNGMDIMAVFGTPIYSPVDGSLMYSEWGHTVNRGGDETAYTVSINLSDPITINGKKIATVFMTHMSGIRYRCATGACNRNIKKGELIGFVGNAAGSATSVGWAPHLHMTFYPYGNYDAGLNTSSMERIYNIPSGTSGYSIVAGG